MTPEKIKNLDNFLQGIKEVYCRHKSLEFYRFNESYFVEYETEESGFKLFQLNESQAEKLKTDVENCYNPLHAAEMIIKRNGKF